MNLSIHCLDGTVISGTKYYPYDPDNSNVLISASLTDIINKIKEKGDEEKEIINDIKDITQNIKDITQNLKVLKQ
jgi:uncharacterized protein (UPF0335 family)